MAVKTETVVCSQGVQKQNSHPPSVSGPEFPEQRTSVGSVGQLPQAAPGLLQKLLSSWLHCPSKAGHRTFRESQLWLG